MGKESKKEIEEAGKRQANVPVPVGRDKGTLVIEMWVPKKVTIKEDEWKTVKSGTKQKPAKMEVDTAGKKNCWEISRRRD